jgi:hypothetical protein
MKIAGVEVNKNKTGRWECSRVGVSSNNYKDITYWVSSLKLHGTHKQKTFSSRKFGFEMALRLAIKQRIEWEKLYHTDESVTSKDVPRIDSALTRMGLSKGKYKKWQLKRRKNTFAPGRDYINRAVEDYLEKGGKITRLETPDDPTSPLNEADDFLMGR